MKNLWPYGIFLAFQLQKKKRQNILFPHTQSWNVYKRSDYIEKVAITPLQFPPYDCYVLFSVDFCQYLQTNILLYTHMGHILNMYKDCVACGLRIYLHNNKISIIVRYKYNIVSLLCVFYRLCCRPTVKPLKKNIQWCVSIIFIVKPTFFSKHLSLYIYI